MKYLIRKMKRDLLKMWTQFFSVFMMAFLGVLIYAALEGVWFSMGSQLNTIEKDTNLADAWVYGYSIEQGELDQIRKISGVKDIAPAITGTVKVISYNTDNDGKEKVNTINDGELKIIATDDNSISSVMAQKGDEFNIYSEGIWLDESYAKALHYQVGESIELQYKEHNYEVNIAGLILHPEYTYYTGTATSYSPQHDKYGYAVINELTAKRIFGGIQYNEVRISMEKGFDSQKLQDQAESILKDKYFGYADRNTLSGVFNPNDKVLQVKKISILFSSLFILLAMLTIQTTMSRLVSNQRIQIGTLKAIGFSNGAILMHYSLYAFTVSVLGGALGVITAPKTVSPLIMNVMKSMYELPSYEPVLSGVSYGVAILVAVCCSLTTIFACHKDLKGVPAETMRGVMPKTKGKTMIEKTSFLWNALSFGSKWSIRDIARNRIRAIMGITGVFGCMMLIIAGLGMQNTLNYANKYVYDKEYTYQSKLILETSTTQEESEELDKNIEGKKQWIMESTAELKSDQKKKNGILTVIDKGDFIHLENLAGVIVKAPDSGACITRKIANQLNVKEGDSIFLRLPTQTEYTKVKITEILKAPLPQGIFISKEAYEELGLTYNGTALLTNQKKIPENISDKPYIKEYVTISQQYNSMNALMKSVSMIFILMIAAAILLGVVILYSLGILSYTERTREYATLKVLGFYQKEISILALRENIITTLIGWLLGLPAGLLFLRAYVTIVSFDSIDWVAKLSFPRFLVASIITVGCSVSVSFFLSLKVKKINMVEALKSIE